MKEKELLVWWLSQEACEAVPLNDQNLPTFRKRWWIIPAPKYLGEQFQSRYGRAGRGRLWVPDHIDFEGLPYGWERRAESLGLPLEYINKCGGIVLERKHWEHIWGMPGIVTDIWFDSTWATD